MKKIGATILQVIVFFIVYFLMSYIATFILLLLDDYIFSFELFKHGWWSGIKDTVFYTFTPIIIVMVVMYAEIFIIKRTKHLFTLPAFIIIAIYLAIEVIFGIIGIANNVGIVSWRMVNQIWYYVILCGGIYYVYKLLKDEKCLDENEVL